MKKKSWPLVAPCPGGLCRLQKKPQFQPRWGFPVLTGHLRRSCFYIRDITPLKQLSKLSKKVVNARFLVESGVANSDHLSPASGPDSTGNGSLYTGTSIHSSKCLFGTCQLLVNVTTVPRRSGPPAEGPAAAHQLPQSSCWN